MMQEIKAKRWPNFFIIGAMKSGSTSLHEYMSRHPNIFLSDPKEPGFFVPEMTYYPKDEDWYLGLFSSAGSVRYIGESSTHYTKQRRFMGVPERIAMRCPDARFLYIMRDPVERTISHYWHNVRWSGETRSIGKAVVKNPDYLEFSDYAFQLEPYIEHFGIDRIYTLTFESLAANPEAVIKNIFTWLGLDPMPQHIATDSEAYNVTPKRMRKARGAGMLYRFRQTRIWDMLAPLTPKVVKKVGNRLAEEEIEKSQELPFEVIEHIRAVLTPRVIALHEITAVDTSVWKNFITSDQMMPPSRPPVA